MKIKNIRAAITGVLLFVLSTLPQLAAAERELNLDMRFAGAFVTGMVHIVDPLTGATAPSALIHTTASGNLGTAETRGFGGQSHVTGFMENCLGIPGGLSIAVTENPLVFAFKDLSLLFAKGGSGQICIDLMSGEQRFVIDLEFDGGRGRFEGATGTATVTGEAEPMNFARTFLAETGTIVGTIILP